MLAVHFYIWLRIALLGNVKFDFTKNKIYAVN